MGTFDYEYDELKDAYIERELIERIKAIKLLTSPFTVDGISFGVTKFADSLHFIGSSLDFDRLAHIVDKPTYETTINDTNVEAFEYDGIEVYRYV